MKSIPIRPATPLPKPVTQACSKLSQEGFKAWLAGGCVRDLIMGRAPRDWDIVTNAPLEKIRELFPNHLEVGTAFGIVKLYPEGKKDPVLIDIAIFRREEGYTDLRHPDIVAPGDETTDVERRDFTVNALYFDPQTGEVLDAVGGTKDIESKVIRTVGNPNVRFSEDALRILRAARFSAQLSFKIETATATAMKKHAGLLKAISRERVREELFRLFQSPISSASGPVRGLEALAQCGLWEQVFGVRKVSLPADFRQLKFIHAPTPLHWICALGVTGLLGDPQKETLEIVERLTERLRLSNEEKRVLARTIRVYEDSSWTEKSKTAPPSAADWLELARTDSDLMDILKSFIRRARGPSEEDKTKALRLVEQTQRWSLKKGSEKAWPNSQDLIKEGLSGASLGKALKARQWTVFWNSKPI